MKSINNLVNIVWANKKIDTFEKTKLGKSRNGEIDYSANLLQLKQY